jgi:hypothetical protein
VKDTTNDDSEKMQPTVIAVARKNRSTSYQKVGIIAWQAALNILWKVFAQSASARLTNIEKIGCQYYEQDFSLHYQLDRLSEIRSRVREDSRPAVNPKPQFCGEGCLRIVHLVFPARV